MNITSSNARHQRIEELEGIISRREDDRELRDYIVELNVLGIPEDMFDNIFVFDELYGRFSEHENVNIRSIFREWVDAYLKSSSDTPISIQRNVLGNIEKTLKSERVLLIGDIESDNAYRTLEDLQKAIWNYPGALEGYDASVQAMGREWASDFVESIKEVFRNRGGVVDNHEFWADCIESIPLQKQYNLLCRIHGSEDIKGEIFQRICAILPSCPGHEFDWGNIQFIISEVERNNLANVS